ncbi:MAG: OmpH family outer membrane protein [Flavobacteriaceae bacterium]
MKKTFLLIFLSFCTMQMHSQKPQRIAYIDMEYILENVPEYLDAQNTLDAKVVKWRAKLDKLSRHIEVLKTDLANEKAILTKDLIEEKEEEITLKQQELRRLESLYFGPNGDMFLLRKQLVRPIQDQVYNAIQTIAAARKYDFVFDKSSELVMLYSNKKYDISDLILNRINRNRKVDNIKKKKAANSGKELTESQKKALAKREAIAAKKLADKNAKKKKIEDARKKKLADRERKRKLLRDKKAAIKKKNDSIKSKN